MNEQAGSAKLRVRLSVRSGSSSKLSIRLSLWSGSSVKHSMRLSLWSGSSAKLSTRFSLRSGSRALYFSSGAAHRAQSTDVIKPQHMLLLLPPPPQTFCSALMTPTATKNSMAALLNVSFHELPRSKKMVPMHMQRITCSQPSRHHPPIVHGLPWLKGMHWWGAPCSINISADMSCWCAS